MTKPSLAAGRESCSYWLGVAHLDRRADERAVLGPRPVVVAHVAVAEDLGQHEPGVAGALADAAVGDHVLVRRDALAAVDGAQLVYRLERAVLGDGGRPRDVGGARDVAPSLCRFLRQVRRRRQLAAVFLGRTYVDETSSRVANSAQHVVAVGANLLPRRLGQRDVALGVGGQVGGQWQTRLASTFFRPPLSSRTLSRPW